MRRYGVAVIGATGTVGRRFVKLLEDHPWFYVAAVAASGRSAGKAYAEAVEGRWEYDSPAPESVAGLTVLDAAADALKIAESADFAFCAAEMASKDETRAFEDRFAKMELPIISNNSAHRLTGDVPMMIPELNLSHAELIPFQRKRLGTRRGFIAVKPNCSIQSYVPALHPLRCFGVKSVIACTYQAISGAGKSFATAPEILDNVIPYIGGGEERKSEAEPLKIWGEIRGGEIAPASEPAISSQCFRVAALDGHMAAVYASFREKPPISEILELWREFKGDTEGMGLPSSPKRFLTYFEEQDRPQTRLDRDIEGGMGIALGRLREDNIFDYKFACLSHNTVRGAAGGGVLTAEALCALGYI